MAEQEPFGGYSSAGVNYDILDAVKRSAQEAALATNHNLPDYHPGMVEVQASRGESAFVWEEQEGYRAKVIEDLGTKNLVADKMREITGKTYYDVLAIDTVAMIINDLVKSGANPQVISAYWAVGDSDWFQDKERAKDLIQGWQQACDIAGVTWGGGETPTLKGVIYPETIDLAGSAVGIIQPKERLIRGDKLKPGDAILLVESNGIHANGLTLARSIADTLPQGYATPLPDGTMYGEALLRPTHIYANLVRDLFAHGIDIDSMEPITGHGWRKIMRADRELTYVIHQIPEPHPVFPFMQQHSGSTNRAMYDTFNMSAGYAIFVPPEQAETVIQLGKENHNFNILNAGRVEEGQKQVIIDPLGITFARDTLEVR